MSIRMAPFSGLAVAAVFMLGGAPAAAAQQVVKLGEGETLTISGFISATLFNDHGLFGGFGQGQNAEFAAAPANQPGVNQSFSDGDVRNTRINFTFTAPPVIGKWAPKAVLESDFFGAFPATPAPPFADEQPQFRIRLAYVDLSNGRTTVRMGQFWSPFFGETPVSLTHIAFPLGYGASGKIGWRFPGIFLYHDLTSGAPVNVQLQLAVMKGSGPFTAGNPRDSVNGIGNGEASGLPQVEALLNFSKKSGNLTWTGYVAGHLDWKDTTGTGAPGDNLTGSGVEVGDNLTVGSLNVRGNFYYGKNLGQEFGHITQQVRNIQGWGAWLQAGYDLDPHWSVFAYYGMDQPDAQKYNQTTGLTLARQLSHVADGLIRYRAGRYAVGLEYFRTVTLYSTGVASADQYALSTQYTF
jgi:hypothetical protein